MALTPQTTPQLPNAVYAAQITLGMSIQAGQPVGHIHQLALQGAYVDPATGAWSDAVGSGCMGGLSFTFDAEGNVIGLPEDLAALGPQIAQVWGAIVSVVESINVVRKLV